MEDVAKSTARNEVKPHQAEKLIFVFSLLAEFVLSSNLTISE